LACRKDKWGITPQTDPDVALSILNVEYNLLLIADNEYRSGAKERLWVEH
jgi:hypothetical protein